MNFSLESILTNNFSGNFIRTPSWFNVSDIPTIINNPASSVFSGYSTNAFLSLDKTSWIKNNDHFTSSDCEIYIVDRCNLGEQARTILGENSTTRFELFKKLKKGWDAGKGLPINFRSVAIMESFFTFFDSFKSEPSLFITTQGNMQLGWEDKNNQVIEIEFCPNHIEYYIESLDEEASVPLTCNGFQLLSSRLITIQ